MTVAKEEPTRKARLKAACALAGITIEEFATRCDVSVWHLSATLAGERESARLQALVDAFIEEQFAKVSKVA